MLNNKLNLSPAWEELTLEKCPQAVQVMPASEDATKPNMALAILGNVVLGSALLAVLMFLPVVIGSFLPAL